MSRFYVGQRARIVKKSCIVNFGNLVTIVRVRINEPIEDSYTGLIYTPKVSYSVYIDGNSNLHAIEESGLAPIYDGDQPASESFKQIITKLKTGKLPALEDA